MRLSQSLLAVLSLVPGLAAAQVQTTLLQDVRPGAASSAPWRIGAVGDTLLFMADSDGDDGPEIWATDGRASWLVVAPPDTLMGQPRSLGLLHGELYLMLQGSVWKTDGLTADTVHVGVTSLPRFGPCAGRYPAAVLAAHIVFAAGDDCAIWAANRDSTWAVINPFSPTGPGSGVAQHVMARGGFAYVFWGFDAMAGRKVFRTTGEPGNSVPVLIPESDTTPRPWEMVVRYEGSFYFESDQGGTGEELWRWDVSAPPVLVEDLAAGPASSTPRGAIVALGRLFFLGTSSTTGRELRMYDGTTLTTPFEVSPGPGPGPDVTQVGHREVGGALYFWLRSGTDASDRFALHKWDGATLRAISTGLPGDDFHEAGHMVAAGGRVWFDGCDVAGVHGASLWHTDGTTAEVAVAGSPGICTWARPFMAMAESDGALLARVDDPLVGIEPFIVRHMGSVDLPDGPVGTVAVHVAPSPIRGRASVTLRAIVAGTATVSLFDPTGRRVATLHEGALPAGATVLPLAAGGLPSGAYLLRAETPAGSFTRVVTVVR